MQSIGRVADPAKHFQEVGYAAYRIPVFAQQIDPVVAVEINCINAVAARHELRDTQRAGIRTAYGKQVELLFACQQQEILQLAAEEIGALRIFERQGGQCVQRAELARILSIDGFHTDHRDNDVLRHTVFQFGSVQGLPVFVPKFQTQLDALRVDKVRTIFQPGLAGRRLGNGVDHSRNILRGIEHLFQFGPLELVLGNHFINEFRDARQRNSVSRNH